MKPLDAFWLAALTLVLSVNAYAIELGDCNALVGGDAQKFAWVASRSDSRGTEALFESIERDLQNLKVVSLKKRTNGMGRSESFDAIFEDGRRAFFKLNRSRGNSSISEVKAYRLDRLLGLNRVPVTVEREIKGLSGSLAFYVEEAREASGARPVHLSPELLTFDYWINNPDRRNFRNVMVWGEQEDEIAIDNGLAFHPILSVTLPAVAPPIEFLKRIQSLSVELLRNELQPGLTNDEFNAFLERRNQLLHWAGLD